jgi:hypothetical protein
MNRSFTAAERRALEAALGAGEPLHCPACNAAVMQQPVQAPPGVSYVRHRVLLVCTGCRRSGAIER